MNIVVVVDVVDVVDVAVVVIVGSGSIGLIILTRGIIRIGHNTETRMVGIDHLCILHVMIRIIDSVIHPCSHWRFRHDQLLCIK